MRRLPIHWAPEVDFSFAAETFNLAGESGVDGARVRAERERAERDKAEAAEIQRRRQSGLTFDGEAS